MPAEGGGWSRAQRRLHWTVALLVPLNLALALVMVDLPWQPLAPKFLSYQLHKSLGLLVFGFVLWRLWLRWRRGRPVSGLAMQEQRLAALGHGLLYALLLTVPVLGWLVAAAAPGGVPTTLFLVLPIPHPFGEDEALFTLLRPVHRAAAWALVLLALGHAALAVRHHVHGRDVLRRMCRG